MNAMNPAYAYGQQWMPEFLTNGACQPGHQIPPQHLPSYSAHAVPQQSTSYHQPPPGMNSPMSVDRAPTSTELPVGSLPNMHSPMMHSPHSPYGHSNSGSFSGALASTTAILSPQSVGPYSHQQLTTPYLTSESQSAPTSPAGQGMETTMHQQWPPTARHYSASPDMPTDIPNIVLTGADGSLDCFQDLEGLRLDNEIQELLSNPGEHVDPACETQLLN